MDIYFISISNGSFLYVYLDFPNWKWISKPVNWESLILEEFEVNRKDLEALHKQVSAERDIAENKLHEIEKLHKEVEEEFNARNSFLFSIERLLKLKN